MGSQSDSTSPRTPPSGSRSRVATPRSRAGPVTGRIAGDCPRRRARVPSAGPASPSKGSTRAAPRVTATRTAAASSRTARGRSRAGALRVTIPGRSGPRRSEWTPTTRFRFPLTGAHRATPCTGCHRDLGRPADSTVSTLVAGAGRLPALALEAAGVCAECHETPHGDQFAGRKDGGRCDACHATDAFAPASRFDHDRDASFALKAGHRAVPCASCHRSDPALAGRVVYRPLSGKCETCHTGKR